MYLTEKTIIFKLNHYQIKIFGHIKNPVESRVTEINEAPGRPPLQKTTEVIPVRLDLSVKRSKFFFNQFIADQLLFSNEKIPRQQLATLRKMQYA